MEKMPNAITATPEDIEQLVSLFNQCRYPEAERLARSMTVHFPADGFGWKVLGAVMKQIDSRSNVLLHFQNAALLTPFDAEALNYLGMTFSDIGRFDKAVVSYYRALRIKPNFAEAHNNLGNMFKDLRRVEESESCYRRALEITPDFAEVHSNLGDLLKDLGRGKEAEFSCRRAIEIYPCLTEAYNNLGNILKDLGHLEEAETSCRRALKITPSCIEAHNNLGNVLRESGRPEEANISYVQALLIKPDYSEAYSNLGTSLRDLCRLKAAADCYGRALKIRPGSLQYAFNAHLLLPIILESGDDVVAWRKRYAKGIATVATMQGTLKEPGEDCNPLSFYLAYHNLDDRSLMQDLGSLFREKIPQLSTTSAHIERWSSPLASGRRIKIGFISEFLFEHTIGNLNQGFIRQLDRDKFEVVILHAPRSRNDAFRNYLNAAANKVLTLPVRLADQQQAVSAERLDVLFYPDIGMSTSTYFLAYARLAPVQAVTWGHPETTGLETIDYFVSVSSFEPAGSEEHYTETLVRLNRLNCFYQPPETPRQIRSRAELGLPESGTMYGCPQSLFKFHPEFDAVLAAIAEGDPSGRIILLKGKNSAWAETLKARWKKNFPSLLERVIFLPQMSRENFMMLQASMDVLLDPIHFGGGNTFYEAMIYGTPMVTWPGNFMRSRIAASGYRQMGIADAPIALSLADYAPLALTLGLDTERRRTLRMASAEAAKQKLFADMMAVREFETFLQSAVEAAGRGKKLPAHWRSEVAGALG